MSSHQRARFICLITGIVVAIPLGFLLMIRSQDQLDDYALHHATVKFIWPIAAHLSNEPAAQAALPRYLTHQSLFGKITLLIYLDAAHPSTHAAHLTTPLRTWIQQLDASLTLREHFAETDLTTTGILVSSRQDYPQLAENLELAQRHRAGRWYALATSPELIEDLHSLYRLQHPEARTIPRGMVIIWDSAAQLRAIVPANRITPATVDALLSMTSRIHFQSSMDEYLRHRTFFGAKKKSSPPSPERATSTDS